MKISPIKKNVPIPPRSCSLYGEITRAVIEMKPGDCREFSDGNSRNIQSQIITAATRAGYEVTTRKINGHGVIAWRVR